MVWTYYVGIFRHKTNRYKKNKILLQYLSYKVKLYLLTVRFLTVVDTVKNLSHQRGFFKNCFGRSGGRFISHVTSISVLNLFCLLVVLFPTFWNHTYFLLSFILFFQILMPHFWKHSDFSLKMSVFLSFFFFSSSSSALSLSVLSSFWFYCLRVYQIRSYIRYSARITFSPPTRFDLMT